MDSFFQKMDKNILFVCVAVIAIIITGVLIYSNNNGGLKLPGILGMSNEKVAKLAIDYINNNNLAQSPASFTSVSEESGLVKIKIKIGDQEFDSYATKDGKLLFPTAISMGGDKQADEGNNNAAQNDAKPSTEVVKTEKPVLEAYVVARCPFGLQMQRAMAEAVKEQPALGQFMIVRYMGDVSSDGKSITAMHGEAEATENLRQICIREEQPSKYWSYVGCQMKASGQEVACEKSTGVDSAKLNSCMSDPSKGVAYAKVDFDLNTKYGVTGSPTLVLNGTTISEDGYGGRSSDGVKSMICAGATTEPGFCSTKLNTASAAYSFSATYSDSGASAGSGSNAANCAPAQ